MGEFLVKSTSEIISVTGRSMSVDLEFNGNSCAMGGIDTIEFYGLLDDTPTEFGACDWNETALCQCTECFVWDSSDTFYIRYKSKNITISTIQRTNNISRDLWGK